MHDNTQENIFLIFIIMFSIYSNVALAGFMVWYNFTGDRNWGNPGNWLGGLPGPADDAIIGQKWHKLAYI